MKFKDRIMNILIMIPTILGIILVSYSIKSIREFINTVITALFSENITQKINLFFESNLIFIFRLIIFISLIFLIIFVVHMKIYNNKNKSNNSFISNDNKLFKGLYKYLEEEKKRCFLITGYWGSGKTHNLNKFLDEYLEFNDRNVYNISCFGISTRTEMMSNIKSLCEGLDRTYRYKLLKLVRLLPVVGEVLFSMFKPIYSLKDIKQGSIFIFDDFERISPVNKGVRDNRCELDKNILIMNQKNRKIGKVKEITYKLDSLDNEEDPYTKYKRLEKYNIVTGLINELIERYKMKVIVLCNTEIIDTEYFREIFDGKLECIRYNIAPKLNICRDIIDKNIENIVSLEDEEREYLEDFFNVHEDEINKVWRETNIPNNRILSGVVSAFIEVVDDIRLNEIKDIAEGIFYSIFIANINNYNSNLKDVSVLKLGENILTSDRRYKLNYKDSNRKYEYLEEVFNKENLVWCGANIALSHITGRPINKNLALEEIKEIKNYKCNIENYTGGSIRDLNELKSICDCEDKVNIYDLINTINNVNDIKDEGNSILKDILRSDIINYDIISDNLVNMNDEKLELDRFFELINKSKLYDILDKDTEVQDILFKNITINLLKNKTKKSQIERRDAKKIYEDWKKNNYI